MQYPWHLYLMAFIYILAGIWHFVKPKMYQRIIPNYLPAHKALVIISGGIEIILGIALCIDKTRDYAIYAIIAMLISFLPAHFYMLNNTKASMGLARWILILRIPLQFVLMYWAYAYLKY